MFCQARDSLGPRNDRENRGTRGPPVGEGVLDPRPVPWQGEVGIGFVGERFIKIVCVDWEAAVLGASGFVGHRRAERHRGSEAVCLGFKHSIARHEIEHVVKEVVR